MLSDIFPEYFFVVNADNFHSIEEKMKMFPIY